MILGREEQFDFEEVSKDESRRISFDMKTRTGAKTPAHEVEDEGDVIKVTMEDAPTTIQVHTADGQTLEVVAAALELGRARRHRPHPDDLDHLDMHAPLPTPRRCW